MLNMLTNTYKVIFPMPVSACPCMATTEQDRVFMSSTKADRHDTSYSTVQLNLKSCMNAFLGDCMCPTYFIIFKVFHRTIWRRALECWPRLRRTSRNRGWCPAAILAGPAGPARRSTLRPFSASATSSLGRLRPLRRRHDNFFLSLFSNSRLL